MSAVAGDASEQTLISISTDAVGNPMAPPGAINTVY